MIFWKSPHVAPDDFIFFDFSLFGGGESGAPVLPSSVECPTGAEGGG